MPTGTPEPYEQMELPTRIFLYTLDQVALILAMPEPTLKRSHIHFQGRSTGPARAHLLRARNIALPESGKAEWRIAEPELVRWMKLKGFRFKRTDRLLG